MTNSVKYIITYSPDQYDDFDVVNTKIVAVSKNIKPEERVNKIEKNLVKILTDDGTLTQEEAKHIKEYHLYYIIHEDDIDFEITD